MRKLILAFSFNNVNEETCSNKYTKDLVI